MHHSFLELNVESASRAELIAHIDQLEFLLAEMAGGQDEILRLREAFGLTVQQAHLLAFMASGRVCSRSQMLAAINRWKDELSDSAASVVLFRVRKKIAAHGIRVVNLFGDGWRIDPAERVRAVMKGPAEGRKVDRPSGVVARPAGGPDRAAVGAAREATP